MGFYKQISKVYDLIFPTDDAQTGFLKATAGAPPKRVLDVACGSGGYCIELAKAGHAVTGVDIDRSMVERAREAAIVNGLDINFFACDMRDLESGLHDAEKFDLLYCIGNSIVHLENQSEIQAALMQMYSLLKPDGTLVLQIINFNRIYKYGITELPPIVNSEAGIDFKRKYEYASDFEFINFKTILSVKNESANERFENSVRLVPITCDRLTGALDEVNFKRIHLFGDFEFSPYDEDSFLLVITADK